MTARELKRQGYSKEEIKEIDETYKKTGYRLLFIPKKALKIGSFVKVKRGVVK